MKWTPGRVWFDIRPCDHHRPPAAAIAALGWRRLEEAAGGSNVGSEAGLVNNVWTQTPQNGTRFLKLVTNAQFTTEAELIQDQCD